MLFWEKSNAYMLVWKRSDLTAMTQPLPRIQSPCISICAIDPVTRCCQGCARTLKEIAQWSRMDADVRDAVMAALPARKALLDASETPI